MNTILKDAFFLIEPNAFYEKGWALDHYFTPHGREMTQKHELVFIPELTSFAYKSKGVFKIHPKYFKDGIEVCDYDAQDSVMCPHYLAQGHIVDIPEAVSSIIFNCEKGFAHKGFIPTFSCQLLMEKESFSFFSQQQFTGVRSIRINDFPLEYANSRGRKVLKEKEIYQLFLENYIDDARTYALLEKTQIFCCFYCGASLPFCAECKSYIVECPECGKKGCKGGMSSGYATYLGHHLTNSDVQHYYVYFSFVDKEDSWLAQNLYLLSKKNAIINGALWNGKDLFMGPEGFFTCTGKVARWFIENQFGNIMLQSLPVDIGLCSKDQRERFESIRFPEYKEYVKVWDESVKPKR